MLNIFADALLIATRMGPLPRDPETRRRPDPEADRRASERLVPLTGRNF
jgi:hypothetical protein